DEIAGRREVALAADVLNDEGRLLRAGPFRKAERDDGGEQPPTNFPDSRAHPVNLRGFDQKRHPRVSTNVDTLAALSSSRRLPPNDRSTRSRSARGSAAPPDPGCPSSSESKWRSRRR